MADKYGNKTGGGSRAGKPNKATAELKDMIRDALDEIGGKEYLMQQAQENPTAFMNLIGKIIPKDVNNTISGGLAITKVTREIVRPKHTDSGNI